MANQIYFSVLSDIHSEFRNGKIVPTLGLEPGDTLILAGDIGQPLNKHGKRSAKLLNLLIEIKKLYEHVIYVPGNHEYYKALEHKKTLEEVDQVLKQICEAANVIFLQCASWVHPQTQVRILGCTLWSLVSAATFPQLNDYKAASRQTIFSTHLKHVAWLTQELKRQEPTIVVTHYLPSFKAVHSKFKDSFINDGFCSKLDHLFCKPVLAWIAGHTHERMEITINSIPLIVNPVGYPGEKRETLYSQKIHSIQVPDNQ